MIKILNSLCYAIIAINTKKQILFVNKYLLDLLELNEEDVLGKNLLQIISITNQPMDDLINILSQKNRFYFHVKNKHNIVHSLCGELIEDNFKGESAYFLMEKKQYENTYTRNKSHSLQSLNQLDFCIKNNKYEHTNLQFGNNLFGVKNKVIKKIDELIINEKKCYSTLEQLMSYAKADGICAIYLDNSNNLLKPIAQSGKVINELYNKEFSNEFYEFINKYGDGIIQLDNIKKDNKFTLINKSNIHNNFSLIGIYKITFYNHYSGFIIFTYEKDSELRNIPINYLKSICSYLSSNIFSLKKLKEEKRNIDKINSSLMEFIDTSEDMITTWDLYGNPIYNNYKLSNILGFDNSDKLNFFNILYPEDKEQILNMMFNDRHDFGSVTSRFRCNDNSYKWIDWNYKILREENIFFFSGRDVSDRITNEKRQLLVEQSQCIEEIKEEFLANITHEFRTPINIIISTIQLISSSLQNNNYKIEDLNEHIKYLRRNSNRLLRLVNNLIDITYIKNGYHKLNMKNYNIVELIENVCDTVIENKENNNINIIFDTDCEEIIMACDSDEIERIILNLLSNAVKYSFTKDPIIVSIKSSRNKIKISVKDHGIGIPKDYLDAVFEKLTRVDNNFTRNNEGSGIGLTIVKSLVNLHEGTIEVKSELGKGSNFIITLPINVLKEDEKINIEKSYDFKNKIEKCAMEFSDIYAYN